jgi:hypothetical protein
LFVRFDTVPPQTDPRTFPLGPHVLLIEVRDIGELSAVRQYSFNAIP